MKDNLLNELWPLGELGSLISLPSWRNCVHYLELCSQYRLLMDQIWSLYMSDVDVFNVLKCVIHPKLETLDRGHNCFPISSRLWKVSSVLKICGINRSRWWCYLASSWPLMKSKTKLSLHSMQCLPHHAQLGPKMTYNLQPCSNNPYTINPLTVP